MYGISRGWIVQTDLTHISCASSATADSAQLQLRGQQYQELIDAITFFQQSEYPFHVVSFIREYLLSMKYQGELQKMVEDENYRLSLLIEPRGNLSNSQSSINSQEAHEHHRLSWFQSDAFVKVCYSVQCFFSQP